MIEKQRILVWDWPVRIGHWLLVILFALAWLTGDSEELRLVHAALGGAMVGVLLFRLLWGFVGPRYARFSDFVYRPGEILAYLYGVLTLRAPRHLGHNPAGGAMIVAMLLALTATVVTGLSLYGADKGLGPLAGWFTGSSDTLIDAIKEAHEVATNGTLLLIAGHLIGVVWESLLHRENLVRAMITGRKRM